MRALITGVTGFVASHLADFLLERNVEVYGTVRRRSNFENIQHIRERLHLVEADIQDPHSVETALKEVEPDYIFHLAAQSFVPTSWRSPLETIESNIIGTLNILEAARKFRDPKIQICGSSEEYGHVHPEELPIKETNPLRPLSPYGVSKVGTDLMGFQYFKSYGLKVVRTRAFNHTGPRRGELFVTSNFAKQIAEVEKSRKQPVIEVGNIETRRDFSDVRDVVRAYWFALEKGELGEVYNICSEVSRTIRSVLDLLLSMTQARVEVRVEPSRIRFSDVAVLQGDCSKFKEQTGWKPEIPFEKTMADLLDYWREKVV
jgi:GDP-4-dehydro-6-deoxy-D-mannose reductase